MKSHWKFTIALLFIPILLVVLFFATIARAQTPSSLDGVEIRTNPSTPSPLENVTVSVESFNTDLNAASIVWVIDGKNYAKGTGITSIQIFAPPLGKDLTVVVVIMTVEGKEVKKTITIKSGGVDLVWESAGYIPPFYRGKALFAYENTIKITAMPHLAGANGAELDPRTLVYKWKENDKVVQDQSGYGKQTLTLQEDIPRPLDITVEVGTRTGNQKGTASITLTPGDPSISFYEEDHLYGVLYNKAITDKITLINPEITIRAVPYTFNTSLKTSSLSYIWSINNLERTDLSTNQSITLRTTGDNAGSSDISLEIRNVMDILQGARNGVSIFFSKKPTP